MAVVALVAHERRPQALDALATAVDWLRARGHEVRLPRAEAAAAGLAALGLDDHALGPGATLAVSLGGDGTMLRAVELVAPHGVPILGVNLGRLGYLASVDPPALLTALEKALATEPGVPGGGVAIEERAMVAATVGGAGRHLALNEVVLEKPTAGSPVRLSLDVDGDHLASYVADGLIVATPTGSTAYAFSARGPVLSPHLRALLVTPVAPHLPFDRSVVLAGGESLRATVVGHRPASLTVDGRETAVLEPGMSMTCAVADVAVRLLSWGRPGFYRLLRAKLGLGDLPPNGAAAPMPRPEGSPGPC